MDKIKEFVTDYIQREYTIPENIDLMTLNYVETGYVDSLGFVQFIATLEDEFNMQFTDEEMASEDIKVVGKLIDMISTHCKI